jgi:zinc transporter, ZIP family
MSPFVTVTVIAGAAAIASVLGGLVALWRRPTTLFASIALGFASGVLLATVSFEMVPQALEKAPLWIVVCAFAAGFAAVWAFDLFVHGGRLIGEHAQQGARGGRGRRRGSNVTVLAGGTSIEEIIEGLTIGIGVAIEPSAGIVVAVAVAIDNFSEGLSVGEIVLRDRSGRNTSRRVLGWTALIDAAVFISALCGALLRDTPQPVIGALFALGAGGIFYLTVTQLIPQAEDQQYQQSAALAIALGFIVILVLTRLL